MPTVTSEKIRSRLESLNAKKEALLQRFLEQGTVYIEAQRELEQDLREELRKGLEREALLGTLAAVRSHAEVMVEGFRKVIAAAPLFVPSVMASPVIESQLREAEDFLAWVRELEARVSRPIAPFDKSKLTTAPDGPAAEGYISVSEARVRPRKQP